MLRHAARGVPWRVVAVVAAAVPALMALTAAWPTDVWPLQGMAVGLLAAAAAWSMDERAAALVDTLPRPLWWRTAARAMAIVPLAALWVACVLVAGDRIPDHPRLYALQGLAALLAGAALATALRSRGRATPGLALAPALVGLVSGLALVRPVPDRLPLFPIWPHEAFGLSAAIWGCVLAAAALALALSLGGPGRSRQP